MGGSSYVSAHLSSQHFEKDNVYSSLHKRIKTQSQIAWYQRRGVRGVSLLAGFCLHWSATRSEPDHQQDARNYFALIGNDPSRTIKRASANFGAMLLVLYKLTRRCGVDATHLSPGVRYLLSSARLRIESVRNTRRGPERSILRLQSGHVTPEEERNKSKPDASTATGADGGRRWGGRGRTGEERVGSEVRGWQTGVSPSSEACVPSSCAIAVRTGVGPMTQECQLCQKI